MKKKVLIVSAIVIVAVLGAAAVVVIPRYKMRREIEQELARLRAAGRPVTMEELEGAHRAGESEAAVFYMKAVDQLKIERFASAKVEAVQNAFMEFLYDMPGLDEAARELVKDIVKRNQQALELFEEGSRHGLFTIEKLDWGVMTSNPYSGDLIDLGSILACRAKLSAENGQTEAAVRDLLTAFRVAASLEERWAREKRIAWFIEQRHLVVCQRLISRGALAEAQLEELGRKLETSRKEDRLQRCLAGERIVCCQTYDLLREGKLHYRAVMWDPSSTPSNFLHKLLASVHPQWTNALHEKELRSKTDIDSEELEVLRLYRRAEEIAQRPFWETTGERATLCAAKTEKGQSFILSPPAITSIFELYAELNAELDIARAAIAAERYRLVHGKWPEKPPIELIDPFSGKSLRYEVKGEKLRVWSVGPNLVDDNGKIDGQRQDDICWELP